MPNNSFEVITKFLPQAVDKYFAAESKTVILENGAKFIDVNFDETGYVKIADFLLDGLSNYYRTQEQLKDSDLAGYAGSAYNYASHAAYAGNIASGMRDGFNIGGTDVRWEIFKLQWCRGRQFRIDHISNEETGKIVTGGIIEEFHRLKVIPEVDACRFSVIADSASTTLGNRVEQTVDETNSQSSGAYINGLNGATGIIHHFNTASEWLTEHEVPEEQQVIFVNPKIMKIIKQTAELNRFLTQEDYRNANGLEFKVNKYDSRPIIEVPSNRFFTNIAVTDNGYMAGVGSRQINFMICSLKAVVPVRKIEHSKLYGEDLTGVAGFYGTMMNYLLYHGVVIPRNKLIGTYVSVGPSTVAPKVNLLSLDLRLVSSATNTTTATNTDYTFKLNAFFTQPSGMRGTVVYAAADSGFTLGSAVTVDGSTIKALPLEGTLVSTAATSGDNAGTLYFALIDYRGICIAKSGAVVLPKA